MFISSLGFHMKDRLWTSLKSPARLSVVSWGKLDGGSMLQVGS
jgi:hypothetical protein